MNPNEYGEVVESNAAFLVARQRDIEEMASDHSLHEMALALQVAAARYRYGYQQLWCGTPVIRLPDDIILLQEIIHELRPFGVIETGVARGGSLLLNASLMEISGLPPKVLGIDIKIYPHARQAIATSRYSDSIELIETDSTSEVARSAVETFSEEANQLPILLILDSNHSHDHVLRELQILTGCLPVGSLVVVADTIIAEMPTSMYENRPWNQLSNPLIAVRSFLVTNANFRLMSQWSRRGLLSEMRDGIIARMS